MPYHGSVRPSILSILLILSNNLRVSVSPYFLPFSSLSRFRSFRAFAQKNKYPCGSPGSRELAAGFDDGFSVGFDQGSLVDVGGLQDGALGFG